MRTESQPVRPEDSRPVGPPGRCTYCREPIGAEHAADCVCRERTVVIDFTVRLVVRVPDSWDEEAIEFKYNESSWCADSLAAMIEEEVAERPRCLCNRVSAEFVREATADDEAGETSPAG